jgi:hypothetical protein
VLGTPALLETNKIDNFGTFVPMVWDFLLLAEEVKMKFRTLVPECV